MEILRLLLEVAGALLLVVATFFLYLVSQSFSKVSEQIVSLTKAIADLREELAKGYVPKGEWEELRKRFHDISGTIGKVDQWQRFHEDDDSVQQKIVELERAVRELTALLHKDFATKDEFNEERKATNHSINNLRDATSAWIADLRAEMERRKGSRNGKAD
jgi:chromosome segregation ATPase